MALEIGVGWDRDDIVRRAELADAGITNGIPVVLETLDVQLMGLSRLDYIRKSRGQVGEDGVKWPALDPRTVERKVGKAKKLDYSANKKTAKGKKRPGLKQVAIGIDKGLQLNASVPGQRGNVLRVLNGGDSMLVGYGMEYSEFFDRRRKLLPEVLPEKWVTKLEKTLTIFGYRAIREGGLFDDSTEEAE